MQRALCALLALSLSPHAAWSDGEPIGPEFRVNTFTPYSQVSPSIASDASGNFVVVWSSNLQDGSSSGVFGQRFASSGPPLGPEFRVNTYTTDTQYRAGVAADASGNVVVVWTSVLQNGTDGVFAQRYASSGAPLGTEFRVNTYTTSTQGYPSVASDPAGNFVVVWQSDGQDGSAKGVFGQRFASSGAPVGLEFRVNTYTTDVQYRPSVAADGAGAFVVAWGSNLQDGSGQGVFGQRFSASGGPLGPEFRVNTYTTNAQRRPSVASDTMGDFVVAWESYQNGAFSGIFAQRFAASGARLGSEFRVNTYINSYQYDPDVASDPSGNFVVVWQSLFQYKSSYGVFGQRFASSGAPAGPEFRVNTYTTSDQVGPVVTTNASGNFVVIWESNTQDGAFQGVFGQRFSQIVPVELMHFAVE